MEGLQRNTTYYFFLRFAGNDKHEKSDWSQSSIRVKTEQTEFDGEINFVYGSAGTAPTQGERLEASLIKKGSPGGAEPNTVDGVWSWYKQAPGQEKEVIKNFYPGEDGRSTYYEIPKDEAPGTIYSVAFVFQQDYKKTQDNGAVVGSVTAESAALLQYDQEKMDKADGTKLKEAKELATDSTITFQMEGTAGLVYGFRYSKGTDVETAEPADYDTYTGTNVTIKGLERNTEYHIWVKVKGNENFADSDWSEAYLTVETKKTSILGYVEIDGTNTAGQKLSAVYNKANYMPVGDDTDGSWQWYREKDDGSFEEITGATDKDYTPTSNDIKKRLKAKYSVPGTSSFIGSKEAVTTEIKKQLAVNPVIKSFVQGGDTAASRPTLDFELEAYEGVWYRIQNATEDAPKVPTETTEEALKTAKWTKCTGSSMNTEKDYANAYLEANTEYTLYVVRPETGDTQVSSIITEKTTIGTITQKGTMSVKNTTDVKEAEDGSITYKEISYPVVGKTITAELENANNVQGTWKWYKSTTDCGANGTIGAPAADSDSWEQLASGYSPTINKAYSTLTINEDLWKHYIKAEFVPNNEIGYGGASIKKVNTNYVRKIYDEQITIESSTKDGKGDDTVYPETKVTANIENWTGDSLNARLVMYVNEQNAQAFTQTTYNENIMTGTAGSWESQNTRNVYAYLTVPKNIMLYVDTELKEIPEGYKSKSKIIPYKSGVPISTAQDLLNLIQATSGTAFESRSADYILTDNIDLTGMTQVFPTTVFEGTFDGDFHSVKGLTTCIFSMMSGSEGDVAEVRNLIVSNANINNQGPYGMAIVSAQTSAYTRLYRILAVQSSVIGNNCGMLVGASGTDVNTWEESLRRSNVIEECASASSSLVAKTGASVGGMTGFGPNVYIKNSLSVQSSVSGGGHRGGFIGAGHRLGYDNMENNYYAGNADGARGGMQGSVFGNADAWETVRLFKNNYYDSTLIGDIESETPEHGIAQTTSQLIGENSQIATNFKANGGSELWKFSNGFYPRLQWMLDKNIEPSTLYSATKGVFVSVDGATNATDMFNGNISGPIKIPEELQKEGYTYSVPSESSSVLKVSEGGTIVPIGDVDSTGIVRITHKDKNSGVESTSEFAFTVKKKTKSFDVKINGSERLGQTLAVTASGVTPTEYKWYKRKVGSTKRELIPEAKTNKYTLKPEDIGYEINVDVSATNYATMSSGFTKAVTSVKPTGIEVPTDIPDNSVTVKAQGVEGADYEYAYASSLDGNKIIGGHSTDAFTISGLSRNTTYWLFARVAGGSGYEASEWSEAREIQTSRTDIVGPVKTNGEVNMEREIRAYIGDDNLQKGMWKIERIHTDGTKQDITAKANKKEQYDIYYTLTKEDVGSKLCFTYNGTGDFKDPAKAAIAYTTPTILKKAQAAPSEPTGEMVDAHTIEISHAGTGTYDFGYTETAGKVSQQMDNAGNGYAGNTAVKVTGLKRNTMYYVYARAHEKEEYEPSGWSAYTTVTTDKSPITGSSEITVSGTEKVEETITFNVKGTKDDTKDLTGIWVLERVD